MSKRIKPIGEDSYKLANLEEAVRNVRLAIIYTPSGVEACEDRMQVAMEEYQKDFRWRNRFNHRVEHVADRLRVFIRENLALAAKTGRSHDDLFGKRLFVFYPDGSHYENTGEVFSMPDHQGKGEAL